LRSPVLVSQENQPEQVAGRPSRGRLRVWRKPSKPCGPVRI
jgi:hypothetical protein